MSRFEPGQITEAGGLSAVVRRLNVVFDRLARSLRNDPVATPASTTAGAGLRVPEGAAPTDPQDGDVWMTTAGMFYRANGTTVGPLT